MNRELQFYISGIREYAVYFLVVLVLLILIAQALLPQIENFITNRTILSESSIKLEELKNKAKLLAGMDKTASRQKLQKLNQALPIEKDVGLMLGALDRIAARSNVRLGNFSLPVGSFATTSAVPSNSKIGVPSIEVSLNLKGDINSIIKFITEAHQSLPVLRVGSISFTQESSTVNLSFYFKPLSTVSGIKAETPLPQVSKKQEDILQKILEREAPFIIQSEEKPTGEQKRTELFR